MLNTDLMSPETRVAAIAYALWLEEGQPEGRAEAHWFKAQQLAKSPVSAASAAAPVAKVKAAAAKKSAPRKRS